MRSVYDGSVDGREISLFTLKNSHSVEATFMNYGATLLALWVPDQHGKRANIVLNYDSLDHYRHSRAYLGATIGRYANRIANGEFVLNGQNYEVSANEKGNTLHGGFRGFDHKVWGARMISHALGTEAVEFSYTSPDGEEGFPGELQVRVTFALDDNDALTIEYSAQSNRDTVLNITNHCYFNLNGSRTGHILNHQLFLNADFYTPVNHELIPTGEIASVEDTPFDFREDKRIGRDIHEANQQLRYAQGYDLNWIVKRHVQDALEPAARLRDPLSGRMMEVFTTEPGIQFYSGNVLPGSSAAGAFPYVAHAGLCLETQHFPDSPNHSNFPSTVLRAGATFRSTTVLRFSQ